MNNSKGILLVLVGALVCFGYHHRYVETLMLSELIGGNAAPEETILLAVFDFDTGLTRQDVYGIAANAEYWCLRIRNVESIRDLQVRKREETQLVADMLEDPHLRKVFRRVLGLGTDAAFAVLQAAAQF